jgi:hypothetical protein
MCGEPMPVGEEMFKFHGYSGPCPKPAMNAQRNITGRIVDLLVGPKAAAMIKLKLYRGPRRTEPDGGKGKVFVEGIGQDGQHYIRELDWYLDLANHSPTGLTWGFLGSGPAQCALAILADATGNPELAKRYHQRFKREVIATFPQDAELLIDEGVVRHMVDAYVLEDGGDRPIDGEGSLYSEGDLLGSPPGHMPLVGTDVEIVAYRNGEDLTVLVNRGHCIYRATLVGAMRKGLRYKTDTRDTFVIRRIGEGP